MCYKIFSVDITSTMSDIPQMFMWEGNVVPAPPEVWQILYSDTSTSWSTH